MADVNNNLQMTVYYLAARAHGYQEQEILLGLDCLIKTKTPRFEQSYTTRTPWVESRALKKKQAVWEGINKGVFIPNDGGWKCRTCGYKTACREWFAGRVGYQ